MGDLLGRDADLRVIEAMLGASGDAPRMLLLEGEAGIGKTTLWRSAVAAAAGLGHTVLRARPGRSERDLAFSALADLLDGISDARIDVLPAPQAAALRSALLRGPGGTDASDPRALGRGLATLLTGLAGPRPALVAIDDVQWLDHASGRALAYALRRLEGRPVHAILTRRSGEPDEADLAGELGPALVRHAVGPMGADVIGDLVRTRVGAASRERLARIVRVSGGNPLHALEVALAMDGADTDGVPAVPEDLRRLVRGRMRRLPRATRAALLRAAALVHPSTLLVDAGALAPAEEADIVSVGDDGQIRFRHPLFAEAVYAAAPRARRRLLHAELAAVADDPEQRAHHLALAADGPAGEIAAALDAAADRAERRGAPDIAARHAEHAARRTPPADTDRIHARLLRAAALRLRAGDADAGRGLAERVVAEVPRGPRRAEALFLVAQTLAFRDPHAPVAPLEEALGHVADDSGLAARLRLGLALSGMAAGDPVTALGHLDLAVALGGDDATRAEAIAFRQAASLFTGRGVDPAELERALALDDRGRPAVHLLRPTLMVASLEVFTGRLEAARARLLEHMAWAAPRGEDAALAFGGAYLATASLLQGELDRAWEEARDTVRVGDGAAFAMRHWSGAVQAVADALRGNGEAAVAGGRTALDGSVAVNWPDGERLARWALGVAALVGDDMPGAVAVMEPVIAGVEAAGVFEWPIAFCIPDAMEALVATGRHGRAAALAEGMRAWGSAHDRPWCTAMGCRGAAMAAAQDGDLSGAIAAVEEALIAHGLLDMPLERARTLLLRGQIERRLKRRAASRRTLEAAHAEFVRLRAAPFVRRAAGELDRVTGRRAPGTLSETELRVARMAAEGHTNAGIASALFMSRRTVESNLARAYAKLGVGSRTQLANAMRAGPGDQGRSGAAPPGGR